MYAVILCFNSVAQRLEMRALDEGFPGSIPDRTTWEAKFSKLVLFCAVLRSCVSYLLLVWCGCLAYSYGHYYKLHYLPLVAQTQLSAASDRSLQKYVYCSVAHFRVCTSLLTRNIILLPSADLTSFSQQELQFNITIV